MWRRLITPTAVISMLWLSIGGATVYYLDWLYHSHSRDLAENFTTIQAADAMQDVLWRLQATAIEIAERADSHTHFEVAELERAFETHLGEAAAARGSPEGLEIVDSIRGQFAQYQHRLRVRLAADAAAAGDRAAVMELSRLAHAIAESCQSLLKLQERHIAESTAQRGRLRVAFGRLMFALWIVGPLAGIASGLWIAGRLQRSIARISISLKDAAGGLDRDIGRVEVSDDLPALHDQVQRIAPRIRQVVEDLQQARQETMLADRLAAVGEMAAGVAHELRNPLTSIKLLMQTAAEEPAAGSLTGEHFHVILEQVIRMEHVIQGLLDFARPPQARMTRHDLRDTLRRALNLVEGHARQQGAVVMSHGIDVPIVVEGDPEQLHQVFVNLLLNGVEAMPDGGTIDVAIERAAGPRPAARVRFSDTGRGIPEDLRDRIFEPFVSSKEHGTGLGLAISRRIVVEHGGTLTAANRKSCGAIFVVELPLAADESLPEAPLRS